MKNQYGVEGKKSTPSPNTKGNPVKHTAGTENKGTKVTVKHAGKGK